MVTHLSKSKGLFPYVDIRRLNSIDNYCARSMFDSLAHETALSSESVESRCRASVSSSGVFKIEYCVQHFCLVVPLVLEAVDMMYGRSS